MEQTEHVTDRKSAGVSLVIRHPYVVDQMHQNMCLHVWPGASLRYVDIIKRASIGMLQTINTVYC